MSRAVMPAAGLSSIVGATLQALQALEVLEVRGNAIGTLPPEVGQLVSLQRIMIELNRLHELPREICKCRQLTHLCENNTH